KIGVNIEMMKKAMLVPQKSNPKIYLGHI
ncbi:hypothetical protein L1283_005164, partial [Sphingobacterium sp. HSC-15S19]